MLSPPMRTVVVVSENQLTELRLTQVNDEIKTLKEQQKELEAAYNRRKQNLSDSLASLEQRAKELAPAVERSIAPKQPRGKKIVASK